MKLSQSTTNRKNRPTVWLLAVLALRLRLHMPAARVRGPKRISEPLPLAEVRS
jgi:hypothetical protein